MSLLLEALKKAERTKQDNAPTTTDPIQLSPLEVKGLSPLDPPTQPQTPSPSEEKLEEKKESVIEDKPSSLAFVLDEKFEPKINEVEVIEITDKPEKIISPPIAETQQISAPPRPDPKPELVIPKEEPKVAIEAAERQAARTLFDAKQPKAKSSKPVLIGGGVLIIIMALLAAGYFYWSTLFPQTSNFQSAGMSVPPLPMRPQAALIEPVNTTGGAANTNEPIKSEPAKVNDLPISGATKIGTESIATSSPNMKEKTALSNMPEKIAPLQSSLNMQQPEINSGIKINRNHATYVLSPLLVIAYQAYLAGDITTAEKNYQQVLRAEPTNRDALLGLAAIALYRGQTNTAETLYLKLLELDPKDALAQASLINLQGQADTSLSESRIKNLLTQQPNASALNFALGNLYATQNRWAEAQQVYFRAYSGEPDNADYLYNLAISLDHLNQPKLALEYYQRALALADKRPISFDKKYLLARIQELLS